MKSIHTTDTKNVDSIIKKGLVCKSGYSEHPTAKDVKCATFSYPIDGIEQELKYWPQNARMKGVELDDSSFIIMDINNCIVGDLELESQHEEYKKRAMTSENYEKEQNYSRYKFGEPEIMCVDSVLPEKILGSLSYSKLNEINNKCTNVNNKYECMELSIKKLLKK